jgi:hypothetical protein
MMETPEGPKIGRYAAAQTHDEVPIRYLQYFLVFKETAWRIGISPNPKVSMYLEYMNLGQEPRVTAGELTTVRSHSQGFRRGTDTPIGEFTKPLNSRTFRGSPVEILRAGLKSIAQMPIDRVEKTPISAHSGGSDPPPRAGDGTPVFVHCTVVGARLDVQQSDQPPAGHAERPHPRTTPPPATARRARTNDPNPL